MPVPGDVEGRDGGAVRTAWLQHLWRIVLPVLEHGARRTLKAAMPVRGPFAARRAAFSPLEACGRTLAGIAPWLECDGLDGNEAALQARARLLAQTMLASITDPASPDALNFERGEQPLVDAAYLAQGLLRAPRALWGALDARARGNVLKALASTRRIPPHYNNWLLFPAMVEACLHRFGPGADAVRIDYAVRQMEQWYVGDGQYADGPEFRFDYYNSFVIHPFLLDILATVHRSGRWSAFGPVAIARAQRYCAQLERMISPEGTVPVVGRSLAYRCGVLHAPAQLALVDRLPGSPGRGAMRTAMDAVIVRMLSAPGTFDADGWLNIGWCGDQPDLAEDYISTGSLYLCTLAFLPLGLPPSAAFWQEAQAPFTSRLFYGGAHVAPDKALGVRA